jgi:acyl-CoA synthetase (AMP-forming)/AMP-acid ligase II
VPLTHANLLANMRDLMQVVDFKGQDRMIGFLPPFHSFGLMANVLVPLGSGLPVVYHPIPTDGAALARLCQAYQVTVMTGTPTFLAGAAKAATDAQLSSLRLVVTGAEKCPDALYGQLAQRWPKLCVLEGYGITECSPVVSANRIDSVRKGSIGRPMPSLQHALVNAENGERCAPGATGMLLVKGPSVFEGYLHFEGPSPFQEFEGSLWYRTGDLVREEADGTLYFMGRLKRFIKLAGEMVSLPVIEEVLLAKFAGPENEGVALAVEATPNDDHPELVLFTVHAISQEAANEVIKAAGLSPLHFVRQVRQVESIPVLGTGKTDYRALKAML